MTDIATNLRRVRTLLGAAALTALLAVPAAAQDTLRVVKHSSLRVLDPIVTTAYMSRNHGYMVYDTLFALDENFEPQPQMIESHEVSDDGLVHTFTLREGMTFHDGAPVTSEDVIPSLRRWGERDSMGQVLMSFVASMDAVDATTFTMTLTEPYGLVVDSLAKPSSNVPFIMPKRFAETPSTEAVPEQIGSGPFVFVADEFEPGVRTVYERFEGYVPRDEGPSWTSGSKMANVDRVEWVVFPDDQTTLNALLAGEIDYWESVPHDLVPVLEASGEINIRAINQMGSQTIMRLNFLHPPFDDPQVRRAAMMALNQEDVLAALVGNPDFFETCPAMFVCGTPLETDIGAETITDGSGMEQARALLAESSYDGTPIVMMHPTDVGTLRTQPVVGAQALRDAGFEVDLQAMDWQTLVGRRASQAPIGEGGWNVFFTNWVGADVFNPLVNNMVNGKGPEGGWFGWPDVPEVETLRIEYAKAGSVEEQQRIAAEIQRIAFEQVMYVPLGQYRTPTAWRSEISGVLDGPVPVFWNITKGES
ncbi:MAG: ABC transporter substrate-binding protein [Pseudomonadota bacterium]